MPFVLPGLLVEMLESGVVWCSRGAGDRYAEFGWIGAGMADVDKLGAACGFCAWRGNIDRGRAQLLLEVRTATLNRSVSLLLVNRFV